MRALHVCAVLWLVAGVSAYGAGTSWQGRCVGVIDGDTISVSHGDQTETIRLYGVDCPEGKQAFGAIAKQATFSWVAGKTVTVYPVDTDRYSRTVAHVVCENGVSLNAALVYAGYAWWYREYAPTNLLLALLETQARQGRWGLWADNAPVSPWEFRDNAQPPADSPRSPQPAANTQSSSGTDQVYITGGQCYHRQGCQAMQATPRSLTRAQAVSMGRRPCSVCNP